MDKPPPPPFDCARMYLKVGEVFNSRSPEIVQETTEKIVQIKQRMQDARDMTKEYLPDLKAFQFVEEPVEIMDREVTWLKRSRIPLVKVRWNSKTGPEFTWEREDQFRKNTHISSQRPHRHTVMSYSDESMVTHTEISSPFEGLSDIGSLGVVALQAPPSPDYIPGPEEPQSPPPPDFPSPTAQSPDYVPESDPKEDPEEDDNKDPKEDPADYPADGGDNGMTGMTIYDMR
ncbi:hypothetical protein Tco_0974087 [Tanacetum coccineum]|uniref:Reverse transcriptase domain-containing protein n=1 Tax=Tanacetum coccineum TaxID=301880 RepID=A0ABQ5EAL1_9ASTR